MHDVESQKSAQIIDQLERDTNSDMNFCVIPSGTVNETTA